MGVVRIVLVVYFEEDNVLAFRDGDYFGGEGCAILEGNEEFIGVGWWGVGVTTWQLVIMSPMPSTMNPSTFFPLTPLDSSTITTDRRIFWTALNTKLRPLPPSVTAEVEEEDRLIIYLDIPRENIIFFYCS